MRTARIAGYVDNTGKNKVYILNGATNTMELHSAHATFLLAQAEAIACLHTGDTTKAIVYHVYGNDTYTCGAMTYAKRREIFRNGIKIS